jgi:RNA polymerase subunit RPABC4/transcription elongation factor Spt4
LTSAELVNFVTKMAALIFVFIFTKHSINALEGTGSGVSFLRGIAVPIASLIIITVAQESVRDLLGPFIGETGNTLLTFASSVIVLAACLWVIFTGYRCSSFLFDFFVSLSKTLRERFTENSISRTCFNCANPVDHHVKYCPVCGVELESRRCKNCHSVMSVSGKYCGQCGHLQEELS